MPNYIDPPTRPPAIQITAGLYMGLGLVFLALRLYSRVWMKHHFGGEDVFMIIATVFSTGMYSTAILAASRYGVNRHTVDIPPHMLYHAQEMNYIYNLLFGEASYFTKLSVLWFSRRLVGKAFHSPFDPHRIALIFLFSFSVVCLTTYIIVMLVGCRPIKAFWDPFTNYPHKCIQTSYFTMIAGIISTITDFACTILPALIVWNLQMPRRQRIAVASVFLIGVTVNVASVLRIYYAWYQYQTQDMWDIMGSYISGNSEIGLGLLCVNAPSIRPLFAHYLNPYKIYARSNSNTYAHTDPGFSNRPRYLGGYYKTGAGYPTHSRSRTRRTLDEFGDSLATTGTEGMSVTVVERGDEDFVTHNMPHHDGIGVLQTVELDSRIAELDPIDEAEGGYAAGSEENLKH